MVRVKGVYVNKAGDTMTGDLNIGLNKLRTTNLLMKESDINYMSMRNAADNAYRGLNVFRLCVHSDAYFVDGCAFSVLGDAGANSLLFKSHDGTALQTAAQLLSGNFELPRGKLTGALDCNSQVLKDLKNTTGALTGTPKVVEIDIGGVPYYFEVLPTKG